MCAKLNNQGLKVYFVIYFGDYLFFRNDNEYEH